MIFFVEIGGRVSRASEALEPEADEPRRYNGRPDEELEHLSQRSLDDIYYFIDRDIEKVRQDRAALSELRRRCRRSRLPTSASVIEALFPDNPMKKKTPRQVAKDQQYFAIRREEGLRIDPDTAEVDCSYRNDYDPYGILDHLEIPEELNWTSRQYFARAPGSEIWVSFQDLPERTVNKFYRQKNSRRPSSGAGVDGSIYSDDIPF
jgi:hypothetical protein